MTKYFKTIVFIIPLVFIGLLIYLTVYHYEFYDGPFTAEGGIIEDTTCVVYLLASLITASLSIWLFRSDYAVLGCLYVVLGLGLFFIAGEEVSWGQRLFDTPTPAALAALNNQGEINLHNVLDSIGLSMLYIVVGSYGAFSRLLVPTSLKTRYPLAVGLLTPSPVLMLYFFSACALYLYYAAFWWWFGPIFEDQAWYAPQNLARVRHQEAIELLLGLGFLSFVAINRYRLSTKKPSAEAASTLEVDLTHARRLS